MRNWKKAALVISAMSPAIMSMPAWGCYYHWSHGLAEPNGVWPVVPSYVPNSSVLNAQDAVTNLEAQDAADDAAVTGATGSNNSSGYWENGTTAVSSPTLAINVASTLYGGSALTTANVPDLYATPQGSPAVTTISDPYITAWQENTTQYGYSSNTSINSVVSTALVNVQLVAYTSSAIYVQATGIPSYALGPSYGSDPNIPKNQSRTYEINRNPVQNSSGTLSATSLGVIGLAVNGVAIYNPWDANYYNASHGTSSTGIWQQNADVVEAPTFDSGPGHADQSGTYHFHESPTDLVTQLDPGNTGQHASPLIGFASDGFPIFGPWGYVTNSQGFAVNGSNGQPEVQLMTSGYSLRSYTNGVRVDPAAPTVPADDGPNVSTTFPLGYYLQDYYYNAGSGVLNQYNMRYGVAPGYSTPIWAYYVSNTESVNSSNGAVTLTPSYPYIIGPDYFGTPLSNDLMGGTVTVPGGVSYFVQGTTADSGSWNSDGSGNWSTVGNWSGALPAGTDSVATFGATISAARTVTLTTAETVGTINFSSPNTYTISGTSRLSMNVSTGQAAINVSAGAQVISAPLLLLAPTTITVSPSTSSLTLNNLQVSSISLTTAGTGTLFVNNVRASSLNISGGTVEVMPASGSAGASVVSSLNISSGATLNLMNNSLIVHGGSLPAITQWIASGYNAGSWNGSGITTSSATTDMALGILLNNNGSNGAIYSTFEGQAASMNDVLVKYTYYGDANLDGKVDGSDYSLIDNGYLRQLTGWSNGDFNYDSVINGSDYTLMDNSFNTQGTQLTAEIAGLSASVTAQVGQTTAVPEPASLWLVGSAALAILSRRRRRNETTCL